MLTSICPPAARGASAIGLVLALVSATPAPAGPAGMSQPASPATNAANAAAARAFTIEAERAIAHGNRAGAERLAAARGAADGPAAAILARLDREAGRCDEGRARVAAAAALDPAGEAALEWGLLLAAQGRKPDARRVLAPVAASFRSAGDVPTLLRAARAARALGQTRTAHTILREAAAQAKTDPAVHTEWGWVLLDAHNPGEATASFRTALGLDAQWAPAHAGLARALEDEDPHAAEAAARAALAIDPARVDAHLFLAEWAAARDRPADARQALDRALAVNPRSADAWALSAAFAFVARDPEAFARAVARALAVNPVFGGLYTTVAAHAASSFRYDDAAVLARQAVDLEGDNPRTHAALGLHLLRVGAKDDARASLERAFKADPYDLVTYNLLQMLDRLDTFTTIRTPQAIVRLDPAEAPVLAHYAVPLVDEAMRQMSARYGFTPAGPISVEIFSKHDDFAVRTAGLPGLLGALGVCFGRVVALDSPRARPPGSFNWQATLWHELAHVYTLQLSDYRVPRWLTEGISVWEEGRVRPEWARDSELAFAKALASGEAPRLADLNAAFTNGRTVELAYVQASLVVELLVDRHGDGVLRDLVRAFAGGADLDGALRASTEQDLAALQAAFDIRSQERYGRIGQALVAAADVDLAAVTSPAAWQALAARHDGSFAVQMAAGDALAAAGHRDAALRAYAHAHALVPLATGPASPRHRAAALAERMGDREGALDRWASLITDDHTNLEAARRTVPLARRLGRQGVERLALERIVTLDPFDAAAHTSLGRLALVGKDLALAVREFRAAVDAGPADPAAAWCDLAEALLANGDMAEAKRAALASLDVAPSYARAQDLLLAIVDRKGWS